MRVAIVNDSALALETLRRLIAGDARHTIAWTARDGQEAIRRCAEDRPDVVLMDLVMPVLNGAEATRRIMQGTPCAVLVVTSTVAGNFDLVCQALSFGAFDAVTTPVLGGGANSKAGSELLAKLDSVDRVNRHLRSAAPTANPVAGNRVQPYSSVAATSQAVVPLVAIGASTGGPVALETILCSWPAAFPAAVVVAQHIGTDFAGSLADWLDQRAKLSVRLAVAGDRPQPGVVLVANGAQHLVMTGPAVAVLLTGIGRDGAEGLLQLHQAGWHTVAQDEASSVVYGMPHAAKQIGAATNVLPLDRIGPHIAERLSRGG
jgi:two-component system response regulator WspF